MNNEVNIENINDVCNDIKSYVLQMLANSDDKDTMVSHACDVLNAVVEIQNMCREMIEKEPVVIDRNDNKIVNGLNHPVCMTCKNLLYITEFYIDCEKYGRCFNRKVETCPYFELVTGNLNSHYQ